MLKSADNKFPLNDMPVLNSLECEHASLYLTSAFFQLHLIIEI